MITAGIVIIVLCLFLGSPIFTVLAGAALLGFYSQEISSTSVATEIYRISSNPIYLTIPLFTFAGYLFGEAGTPRRLVKLTRAFFGWFPGGLSIVALVACSLFTAFTGASGVTIVALGALLYPAMMQDRYKEGFTLGLVTSGGSLGLLFAPSIPLILYGVISKAPILDMFLAGIVPGVLMILLLTPYCVYSAVSAHIQPTPLRLKTILDALWEAKWEIPLPVIVLGGIYSGYFAASEAAAVTAFYALVVEVCIYRDIKVRQLVGIIRQSMIMVGGVMIIVGAAMSFTNYCIDADVPTKMFEFLNTYISSKLMFLLLLNGFLLILGMLLDIFSAIIVVVPLILPVAQNYGINPVHLGMVFLSNMQIGYLTPPVGMSLFISSYRFKKSVIYITRSSLPFMAILLLCVLLITYWPDLSFWVLRVMGKQY
jgi:C4-dicarboxylate transporter DctM subunit